MEGQYKSRGPPTRLEERHEGAGKRWRGRESLEEDRSRNPPEALSHQARASIERATFEYSSHIPRSVDHYGAREFSKNGSREIVRPYAAPGTSGTNRVRQQHDRGPCLGRGRWTHCRGHPTHHLRTTGPHRPFHSECFESKDSVQVQSLNMLRATGVKGIRGQARNNVDREELGETGLCPSGSLPARTGS